VHIRRLPGTAHGRSQAVTFNGLVWAVGSARNTRLDLKDQTRETLQVIEQSLMALGSDKTRLLSAQVFLTDMNRKAEMDEVWNAWIGPNPEHWPQRACLGTALTGDLLVEVTVIAAIRDNSAETVRPG
jgi:enamine deaminase RidA (YjgF/YER057c/UK114 family)